MIISEYNTATKRVYFRASALIIVILSLVISVNYAAADTIESPLQQIQNGIAPEDVTCRGDLVLIIKSLDGSPACVSIFTKDRLEQREWSESEGFGAMLPEEPIQEKPIPTVETDLDEGIEGSALKLTGEGYLVQTSSTTNKLSNLSVTVWVKPDYSEGSSEFTILSKHNAFVLAINNYVPPEKKAKFSIFDGIKWTTVVSKSSIEQEWTHLAATFDRKSIAIYVNGKLDSSIPLEGVPALSASGKLTTTTVESITSDSDIVIGAYISKIRNEYDIKNRFSGLIDSLGLFGSLLDESKISEIYSKNLPSNGDGSGIITILPSGQSEEGFGAILENPNNAAATQEIPTPIESWEFEAELESGGFGAMLSTASPLQQVRNGISPQDVVCSGELVLIIKSLDGSPACVNLSSVDELINRGWAYN